MAQGTTRGHSASTRRPNQASSGSFRSESPRARRIRCAQQVCRACSHWQYTPSPSLTRIPAQRAIRASQAAVFRLACPLHNATGVLTMPHHHANTPCWSQLVASMSLTVARRAFAAIASYPGAIAAETRSTAPWTAPRLRWTPKTDGQNSCTALRLPR